MINEEIRHIVEPELAAGEELLWVDRPNGLFDYPYLIIFLLSCLLIIGIVHSNLRFVEPLRELTEGLPFLLPGILGLTFLVSIRSWFLKTEVYAISDKNIFIHSKIPTRHMHMIPFSSVTNAKRSFLSGTHTINLTLKGQEAHNAKAFTTGITVGFWTRVVVQIKQISNPRIPLELISKQMETTS